MNEIIFKKDKRKEEVGKQWQVLNSISFFPRKFLPVNSFQNFSCHYFLKSISDLSGFIGNLESKL